MNRAAIWEVDRAPALADIRQRPAQSQRPELRAAKRRAMDSRQRARRARPRSRARLHDFGEGRRILRLALQLFRPASRSAGQAAAPGSRRQGDGPGLCVELACRAAWACVRHRRRPAGKYRGGAFVGEHGSWDRPELNGYKVVFVPFSDGQSERQGRGRRDRLPNAQGEARGRPVASPSIRPARCSSPTMSATPSGV